METIKFIWILFFKKKANQNSSVHIMDLLHNNNFSDHNIIFRRKGFFSFQIMVNIKESKTIIKKYFDLAKKYKYESYLSTIKFLPKRSDFLYDYDKHIAIEIYSPRSK